MDPAPPQKMREGYPRPHPPAIKPVRGSAAASRSTAAAKIQGAPCGECLSKRVDSSPTPCRGLFPVPVHTYPCTSFHSPGFCCHKWCNNYRFDDSVRQQGGLCRVDQTTPCEPSICHHTDYNSAPVPAAAQMQEAAGRIFAYSRHQDEHRSSRSHAMAPDRAPGAESAGTNCRGNCP